MEGEDLEHDGDRDEWETASESSNVARHARANRSADSSPAPTDARRYASVSRFTCAVINEVTHTHTHSLSLSLSLTHSARDAAAALLAT